MKNLILATLLTLTALSASADRSFYECTLPQADEYRVGIDLNRKIAGFFDNDTTTMMNYIQSRKSKKNPNHKVLIYRGQDSNYSDQLLLEFNISTKHMKLSTISKKGRVEPIGAGPCAVASPWKW